MRYYLQVGLKDCLRLILLLVPLLFLSSPLKAKSTTLLVVGDSLSAAYGLKQEQGWVYLLAEDFKKYNITVINASVSGETSSGGLARLPRLLEQHKPSHVLIELGGNDGLRGLSIKAMRENINKMVMLSKTAGAEVMLAEMQIPPNYGRRYSNLFLQSFTDIAEQQQLLLIRFINEIASKPELMQKDGIHPNAIAQPIIANMFKTQLSGILNITSGNS